MDGTLTEAEKCKDSVYFVENYLRITTPRGPEKIVLRQWDKELLKMFEDKVLASYTPKQGGEIQLITYPYLTKGRKISTKYRVRWRSEKGHGWTTASTHYGLGVALTNFTRLTKATQHVFL